MLAPNQPTSDCGAKLACPFAFDGWSLAGLDHGASKASSRGSGRYHATAASLPIVAIMTIRMNLPVRPTQTGIMGFNDVSSDKGKYKQFDHKGYPAPMPIQSAGKHRYE